MENTTPEPAPERIVHLQKAIAQVILDAQVSRNQAAVACLLIATSITRDNPTKSHADLVELLRTMESLPQPNGTVEE